MHELTLIKHLFEIMEDELKKHGKKRVTFVKLKIGKLSGAVPSYMEEAFQFYSKGTFADGAELQIEVEEPLVLCEGCGNFYRPDDFIFLCPKCGEVKGRLHKGGEILLESLEVL